MHKLLERDPFLQKLNTALHATIEEHGQVALISGEAGIGKTSLVDLFTQTYREQVRVLWGACDSLFTPRPLGPLFDIALQVDGEFPVILRTETDQHHIFSACLTELQDRPTILVIEDVHWADEATLDLIKYLGRRIQLTHTLLVLTYRDDEIDTSHPLRLVLGELPRTVTVRLPLMPLSKTSVLELAREVRQADRIDDLYLATGGNPFFVTEALASETDSVPPTVRDAVQARAAHLSTAAREVLDAASVVPGRIETWLLKELFDPTPTALEECVERGMFRMDGDSFIFRHELTRRAIEDNLPLSQRQALHQKILQILMERENLPIQLSRLVHHASLAGNSDAVLLFAPQAAWQAATIGSHLEALAHYQTVLNYKDKLEPKVRAGYFENLAYECYLTSQIDAAIQARMHALEIWRREQDLLRVGDNLRWLSRLYWFLGQRAQAERYSAEAIQLLQTLPPSVELAMAYSNRSQLHMLNENPQEAIHWGTLAIELAENIGDTETLVHALNNVGASQLVTIDEPEGIAKLLRSLDMALAYRYEEHVARAYTNLAWRCVERRDYNRAFNYLNTGIDYSVERDLDAWKLYMKAGRARTYFEQGLWAEASEDALAVINDPRVNAISKIPALVVIGNIRLRRGDPHVQAVLDEALQLAIPTGESQRIGPVVVARAEAQWLAGNLAQGQVEALSGYQVTFKSANPRQWEELSFWLWRLGGELQSERPVSSPFGLQIAGEWQAAAEAWEKLGCPYEQALALMDGDRTSQLQALEIFEHLGARPAVEMVRKSLQPNSKPKSETEQWGGLTTREKEVAQLIAAGKSNREIAAAMTVGVKTVETYVTRILGKLDFDSRVQIATWVLESRLK